MSRPRRTANEHEAVDGPHGETVTEGASANGKQTRSRLRWPKHLPKPRQGDVPYAKRRLELAGLLEAEHALLVRQSRAWQEVMVPACKEIDQERSKRGHKFLYESEELELALLFGRAMGLRAYKETRAVLAGDDPRPRQLLGFANPRNLPSTKRRMRLRDGVPSEATMSRHKARLTEERRDELWLEIERRLRLEHIETPELQDESSVMYIDGTAMLTHYTCPAYDGADHGPHGKKITCPDGGYIGTKAPPDKRGQGFNLVMIASSSGVPLAWRVVPLHHGEPTVALELVRNDFRRDIAPYLHGKIKVLAADGAFHSPTLRAELRRHGIVENIHLASHAKKSKERADKMTEARHQIVGYENWFANDHREILCRCGRGVSKVIEPSKDGKAIVRVEGKCPKCGTISIKSGDWRYTQDNRFVRCHPDEKDEDRDWALGNPLTFNDLNATEYGKDRFGHNEGLHGALVSRYQLIKHKRWFRRVTQARIDTAMTFALMHAIALEQRRLAGAANAASGAPPGSAVAA